MKKVNVIVLTMLAASLCAVAGEDTTGLSYIGIGTPGIYTNSLSYAPTSGTNGIDVSAYKGNASWLVEWSGNVNAVAITNGTVVLQHSTLETGTYANVSGMSVTLTATGGVAKTNVDLASLKKYVRIKNSMLGTNVVKQVIGSQIVAPHKSD